MFAEISFPVPINKTFHYKVPVSFEKEIAEGDAVKCRFGRSLLNGTVISLGRTLPPGLPPEKVREIEAFVSLKNLYDFKSLKNTVEYCFSKWHAPKGMYYGLFYENIFEVLSGGCCLTSNNAETPKVDFFPDRPGESVFWQDDFPLERVCSQISANSAPSLFLCPDYLSALSVYRKISAALNGDECAFYHGSLTKAAKKKILAAMLSGKIRHIIGTKAAVFLPYRKGTLISVLRSRSDFYFQFDQRPFYKTCDLAQKLASEFSHRAAFFSCYTDLELPEPAKSMSNSDSKLTPLILKAGENFSVISQRSIEETQKALSKGEKVLYLAPSRGVAFKSFCPVCKWSAKCPECLKNLRLFSKDGTYFYICPSCLKKTPYSNKCPVCSAEILKTGGHGSQKIAQELESRFPQAKIFRIDSDSLKKSFKGAESVYSRLSSLDYDIIAGTSFILAPEIYEKKFALAVLAGFHAGMSAGFRESERLFNKISAAARLVQEGGLLIAETFEPDNPVFSFGLDGKKFTAEELEMRRFFVYPPFCDLLTVRFSSSKIDRLKSAAGSFIAMFTQQKLKELRIIEHKPKETVKTNKQTGISYHDTLFKIEKDSKAMAEFLSSLDLGREIEVSVWPEWFF